MLAVIAPKEMLDPIFKHTIPSAPKITVPFIVNFCRLNLSSAITIFFFSLFRTAEAMLEAITEITIV